MSKNRNYVAAWVDYKTDQIVVLERDQDGKSYRTRHNPPYYFYVPAEEDDKPEFTSIFGDKLIKAEFDSREAYESAKRRFSVKFESDIAPLKRVLMDKYYDIPAPPVNFAFLDIEVDYKQSIGFAGPTNPYGIINAVTVYQSWTGKFITLVVPPTNPDGVRWDQIPGNNIDLLNETVNQLVSQGLLRKDYIPEIRICRDETELLQITLDAIQNADIISGWNSEFYDIPYIAERLLLLGGEALLQRLDYAGVRAPRKEMVNRFGSEEPIYKFTGRSHLDYMKLFKKFTFEGRTSYSLGNILQEEVGIGKLEYSGSLEDLYNNNFPLFVAYNFRDVDGLLQLDEKFKFIALANQMAHENTVHFDAVLGTVAYVETGITNHAHYALNKIVHDKRIAETQKVEGAIVLTPTPAMHEWIGSVDINSLYPNTIRTLNISPEKIIGQFDDGEKAWRDIWNLSQQKCTLILEDNQEMTMSGEEWKHLLGSEKWSISAYGTVFDQSSGRGVVADILGFWYTERKRLQAEKKKYAKLVKDEADPIKKAELKKKEEHFDLLQLTKKISMNSLYGALLNPAFRFGDERMGASVTASGRAITTHMINYIEEIITGVPKKYVKVKGKTKKGGGTGGGSYNSWHYITQAKQLEVLRANKDLVNKNQQLPEDFKDYQSIIYGDTDSAYFKTLATTKEEAIETADLVATTVNDSFVEFVNVAFNVQPDFNNLIKAGREVVGRRGIFQAKKKYMIKVVDLEGFAVNKLKTQGSEIKKADTPKVIQVFLKNTVDMILEGETYENVCTYVNDQRKKVLKSNLDAFSLGVAKQVNNLDKFLAEYLNPGSQKSLDKNGKMRSLTIPGHVAASLNYNRCLDLYDRGSKAITSGDKVLIFYLKPNEFGFRSMAIPAEAPRFPAWFTQHFVIDIKMSEEKMFDSKLEGIFAALNKDVPSPQSVMTNNILGF